MKRKWRALGGAAAALVAGAAVAELFHLAAANSRAPCDPDVAFTLRPDWSGPLQETASVEVNAGNTPESFVRAAYWQINGAEPPAALVASLAEGLRTLPYRRRADVVHELLRQAGKNKPTTYSDPWQGQPALLSLPVKNRPRDIGAVLMYSFECPRGTNCRLDRVSAHAPGMDRAAEGGAAPLGVYNAQTNPGFWERELLDARYAGLQFLLLNTYGPDVYDGSLANLDLALEAIDRAGLPDPVKVSLFDDTTGWGGFSTAPWNEPPRMDRIDPQPAAYRIYEYKWRPFYAQIPREHWYLVHGRPLIYFYDGGTLGDLSQSAAVIRRARELFARDFGVAPWVVVDDPFFIDTHMQWEADSSFTWKPSYGDRLARSRSTSNGLVLDHGMARWNPVARDSDDPLVVATPGDRLVQGAEQLQALLRDSEGADVLVIATWNDLGEGTAINRADDYWDRDHWLMPDAFMNLIRASQSLEQCGARSADREAWPPLPQHGSLVADFERRGAGDKTLWNGGAIKLLPDSAGTKAVPSGSRRRGAAAAGRLWAQLVLGVLVWRIFSRRRAAERAGFRVGAGRRRANRERAPRGRRAPLRTIRCAPIRLSIFPSRQL